MRRLVGGALGLVLLGTLGCSASGGTDRPGAGAGGSGAFGGDGFGGTILGTGAENSLGGFGATGGADSGAGCGTLSIDTSVEEVVTPGNVLIIFDQSDSMSTEDFNGQARWKAASDALIAAITPNKNVLTIGAIFFPSVLGLSFALCDVSAVSAINDTTSPNPQIPFMPGAQFIDAWAKHWAPIPLVVGTPIDAGMQRGDEALTGAGLKGNTIVVFVTDGVPTCVLNNNSTVLPAKWLGMGIPTHVIGLPGAGQPILQSIATAGGTQNFLLPSDGAQLQQQLSSITSTIVKHTLSNCQIKLSDKPPGDVVLVVTEAADGKQYAVNPGSDGWTLAPDGSSATLNGATCTDATGGRFSKLSFGFQCASIPLLR
jgi:hypothetical protein